MLPVGFWSEPGFCRARPRPAPPTCPLAPPPRRGSPTQRARDASSWKPPGHSHTAPPGRGTQRPLTQRHSSESSSELSSSAPAERMRRQHCPRRWPRTRPSRLYTHLWRASPAAGDSCPRKNYFHSATSGTGTLRGAGGGQQSMALIPLGSRPQTPSRPTPLGHAHQRRAAGTDGTGLPSLDPGDSSSHRR